MRRIMGRHTAPVGPELWKHNQTIYRAHQGRAQCSFLCGQQTGVQPVNTAGACDSNVADKRVVCIVKLAAHWHPPLPGCTIRMFKSSQCMLHVTACSRWCAAQLCIVAACQWFTWQTALLRNCVCCRCRLASLTQPSLKLSAYAADCVRLSG